MGQHDNLGAALGQFLQGSGRTVDAGGIGDLAVLGRHVEIGANQNALTLDVKSVDGAEHGKSPFVGLIKPGAGEGMISSLRGV
jgi:hypothetical protein